jgi:hypothetical protein
VSIETFSVGKKSNSSGPLGSLQRKTKPNKDGTCATDLRALHAPDLRASPRTIELPPAQQPANP